VINQLAEEGIHVINQLAEEGIHVINQLAEEGIHVINQLAEEGIHVINQLAEEGIHVINRGLLQLASYAVRMHTYDIQTETSTGPGGHSLFQDQPIDEQVKTSYSSSKDAHSRFPVTMAWM
jgi:predicted nuclease with RNAse H fold